MARPPRHRDLRGTPLFGDPDRLLLTLLYQWQVCSMKVLGELLEVTAICIAALVRQTARSSTTTDTTPGSPRQAAQAERLVHQRRVGPR